MFPPEIASKQLASQPNSQIEASTDRPQFLRSIIFSFPPSHADLLAWASQPVSQMEVKRQQQSGQPAMLCISAQTEKEDI